MIYPKDTIIFDDASRARVLGGASHRLWLQSENSGEVLCMTKDTLTQLVVNKSISLSQSPQREVQSDSRDSTFFDAENYRSTAGITKELTLQRYSWSKEKDVCLTQWLDIIARTNQMNPLNLMIMHITRPRDHIMKYANNNCYLSALAQLYAEHSDLDILLRSIVIIHMNDLLLPMLPFLSPHDGEHLLNHPSCLLYHLRDLVFMSVRGEFFFRLSQSSQSYSNRTTQSQNHSVKDGSGYTLGLEIKREEIVLTKILNLIHSNSYENKFELPVSNTDPTVLDDRWRLLIGIQASLIGQMYQYFETLSGSGTPSSIPGTSNPLGNNDGTSSWENILRAISYRALDDRRNLADREIPFVIKCSDPIIYSPNIQNQYNREDELFYLLQVAKELNEQGDDGIRISEWSIFCAFVTAAIDQANLFILSIFYELYTAEEMLNISNGVRHHSFEVDRLSAGEINLILQYLHALGVLVGLCIRAGVLINLHLPEIIIRKFGCIYESDHTDSKVFSVLFYRSAYLSIRQGITSIFPESAFVLLSQYNMLCLFRGACPCTTVELLQRCCILEGGLTDADTHIKHFFICLRELNPSDIEILLKLLWAKHHFIGEIYYVQGHELPAPFHIIPPTAMALLSPDEADIIIFSDRNSISIPRYSSISVMDRYIKKIINGNTKRA